MAKVDTQVPPLYGVLIRSSVASGSLASIKLPPDEKRFLPIDSSDVIGENSIHIFTESFPLLAESHVSYKGEPLVAYFGPDFEAAIARSKRIEFEYGENSEQEKHIHSPITYSWGDLDKVFLSGKNFFERTYYDRILTTGNNNFTEVIAYTEDDLLKIEVPTQWPFNVRENVAAICQRTQKSVVVYPQSHFSPKDEKLIEPTILSCIAALAALKHGGKVVLRDRNPIVKSPFKIFRMTALDEENRPIAERVEVVIDQGAYPLFTTELFKQVLAGLIPLYPLQAFEAEVKIVESSTPFSHFYGDLGYSSALFSTEEHASLLGRYAQMSPANWRLKYYGESEERSKVIETLPFGKLRDLITLTTTKADFSRRYGAYELQRRSKKPLSPFLTYYRGIGIACGGGISGFSSESPYHRDAKIAVTLDTNSQIIVNTSYFPSRKTVQLWRSIIAKELAVEQTSIKFVENDSSKMVDTGLEVLSLDVERSAKMLVECCRIIKNKRFQEPLPITESVTAKSIVSGDLSLFTSQNWGCIIIEIGFNTVTLESELRRVWANFSFNNPPDVDQLRLKFKHIISETLNECNIKSVYRADSKPTIDIAVDRLGEQILPTSATSALRAMVMACVTMALSQAFNQEVTAMPLTSEDILQYIKRDE